MYHFGPAIRAAVLEAIGALDTTVYGGVQHHYYDGWNEDEDDDNDDDYEEEEELNLVLDAQVKHVDHRKAFCFAVPIDGSRIFVPRSKCVNGELPRKGDRLNLLVGETEKGFHGFEVPPSCTEYDEAMESYNEAQYMGLGRWPVSIENYRRNSASHQCPAPVKKTKRTKALCPHCHNRDSHHATMGTVVSVHKGAYCFVECDDLHSNVFLHKEGCIGNILPSTGEVVLLHGVTRNEKGLIAEEAPFAAAVDMSTRSPASSAVDITAVDKVLKGITAQLSCAHGADAIIGTSLSGGSPSSTATPNTEVITFDPAELLCTICLDICRDAKFLSLCGHCFCGSCLDRHMRQHSTCPTCRADIADTQRCANLLQRRPLDELNLPLVDVRSRRKINQLCLHCPVAQCFLEDGDDACPFDKETMDSVKAIASSHRDCGWSGRVDQFDAHLKLHIEQLNELRESSTASGGGEEEFSCACLHTIQRRQEEKEKASANATGRARTTAATRRRR